MNNQRFYATFGYKIFMVLSCQFSIVATIGIIYLYSIEKAPLLVGVVFFVISVTILIRTVNLCRFPDISFDGKNITIRGWFGGVKEIDPYSEMEIAMANDGFIIKQGKVGAALVPQVVGKKQFSALLKLVAEAGETPLTKLST
jgi:hypothetical protein